MSKENLGRKGYDQGNMAPDVEDFQKPMADFAEEGFSKTTQYIERKNGLEKKAANDIKKQHYKGRYS